MAKRFARASFLAATTLFTWTGVTTSAVAAEDGYWARRSDEMVEHSHLGTLTMHAGHAKLVVRRTVDNGGERNDEANFDIRLPNGAVAVGLRTLALKNGAPHWYRGDLMEAEAAAQKYLELTGIGGAYPKDPALLSWRSQGHLRLQVFPCPPSAKKSVEYTLLLPTTYTGGEHVLTLPRMGTAKVEAEIRLAPAAGKLAVDGKRTRSGHKLVIGDDGEVTVSLTSGPMHQLGGGLAVVAAGKRSSNRFHLEAAPRLTPTPRGAKVVVLIDVSRSWNDSDVEAARRAAIGYLERFAGARAEVITFARHATRQHGRFVSAKKAAAKLKKANLSRHNGSFVDDALEAAEKLLAKHRGPKRIVLFTDTEIREAIDAPHLRAMLSGKTLLHVVRPRNSHLSMLARDDTHAWSDIPKSTGGLFWHADVHDDLEVFEELVRPTRIHNFAIAAAGFDLSACSYPSEIAEGEGVTCSSVDETATRWVSATGQLWNKPIRTRIRPSKAESDRWASLVFGHADHALLSEEEMMGVAMRGKAVSPVTSYLAIEPGVRPSKDGLAHGRMRGRRMRPPRVRMGGTNVSGKKAPFDAQSYLTHAFASAWLKCGGAGKDAAVRLETNYREIIDVYQVSSKKGTTKQVQCLTEAVWAEALPVPFEDQVETWFIEI